MTAPRKALVLAAGLGTRLRPLTETCPKPLIPIWGAPLIERVLRLLENWGVEEVVVNLHWQAERVEAYLKTRAGKARIRFSREPRFWARAARCVRSATFSATGRSG
jgi:NDP-sugar pyrophosphorylase family protein